MSVVVSLLGKGEGSGREGDSLRRWKKGKESDTTTLC